MVQNNYILKNLTQEECQVFNTTETTFIKVVSQRVIAFSSTLIDSLPVVCSGDKR